MEILRALDELPGDYWNHGLELSDNMENLGRQVNALGGPRDPRFPHISQEEFDRQLAGHLEMEFVDKILQIIDVLRARNFEAIKARQNSGFSTRDSHTLLS